MVRNWRRQARLVQSVEEKTFPGTLESLAPVREYVAAAARVAGLDSTRTYNLCLAVDEIATNIVLHGYEEAGIEGDIVVEVQHERGQLVVRLLDRGRTYNPDQAPQPDLDSPLSRRKPGGWGLFLAKTGVDQFQYTSTDAGNVHRFVMIL